MKGEIEELRLQVTEVQSQLAFQEDTVQVLNDALSSQQQEILLLRRQLELIKQRQDEQAVATEQHADQSGSPLDDKPPHY